MIHRNVQSIGEQIFTNNEAFHWSCKNIVLCYLLGIFFINEETLVVSLPIIFLFYNLILEKSRTVEYLRF